MADSTGITASLMAGRGYLNPDGNDDPYAGQEPGELHDEHGDVVAYQHVVSADIKVRGLPAKLATNPLK